MNIVEAILDVSNSWGPPCDRDPEFCFKKLIEEQGEYAKAINQPERCDEPFYSEAADVLITLIDHVNIICSQKGLLIEEVLEEAVKNKLQKWQRRMNGG